MSKILSTKYSAGAFNIGMLILRLGVGILIAHHGFDKLVKFNTMKLHFLNFLGLGSTVSLSLVIFAEFFCAIFLILGLFTRLAVIPIMIVMLVALFQAHNGDIFFAGEKAAIFLAGALTILFCGPGKISVDGMIGK